MGVFWMEPDRSLSSERPHQVLTHYQIKASADLTTVPSSAAIPGDVFIPVCLLDNIFPRFLQRSLTPQIYARTCMLWTTPEITGARVFNVLSRRGQGMNDHKCLNFQRSNILLLETFFCVTFLIRNKTCRAHAPKFT